MAHKKGGGSSRNGRDSNAQRLGVSNPGSTLVLVAMIRYLLLPMASSSLIYTMGVSV